MAQQAMLKQDETVRTQICNVDTADHPMSHEIKGW